MRLELLDIAIIVAFFVVSFAVGVKDRGRLTLDDYWANGRQTGTFVLTATMLSTFIGAGSLIGLANVAFRGGSAALIIAASYVFYFLLFALFLAARIKRIGDRLKAYTIPDVLAVRFGQSARAAAALVNLLMFGCFLASQFVATGAFVSLAVGSDLRVATAIGGVLMVVYTSVGGLRADIRTDVFQFFVMLILVVVFLPRLVSVGGGLAALRSLPPGFDDGTAFMPASTLVAAFLFLGLTPVASADVWQRAYAAKDERTVRRAMFICALLLVPFYTLGTAMGVYGKLMFPEMGDANLLVSEELSAVLPTGLLGLAVAGFLAALMSTADTMLLVLSQTLVRDVYQGFFRPELSEEEVFRLSRKTTLILGVVAILVAVFVLSVFNLTVGAVSFGVVLIPPTVAALFWKRATGRSATAGTLAGLLVILVALPSMKEEAFIPGFLVSAAVLAVVAMTTKHGAHERDVNTGELLS